MKTPANGRGRFVSLSISSVAKSAGRIGRFCEMFLSQFQIETPLFSGIQFPFSADCFLRQSANRPSENFGPAVFLGCVGDYALIEFLVGAGTMRDACAFPVALPER